MRPHTLLPILASLALAACTTEGGGPGGSMGAASGGMAMAPGGLASAKDLVGRSERDVRSTLGTPSFTRADGPAKVWQYSGSSCLLDVFLYKEGSGYTVKHAEVRQRSGVSLSEPACLANAVAGGKVKS
jgi:hypothetical protein